MFEPIYRKYYDDKNDSLAIYKQITIKGDEVLFWSDKKRYWHSVSDISQTSFLEVEILDDKSLDDLKVRML